MLNFWEMLGLPQKLMMFCIKNQNKHIKGKFLTLVIKFPIRKHGNPSKKVRYMSSFLGRILKGPQHVPFQSIWKPMSLSWNKLWMRSTGRENRFRIITSRSKWMSKSASCKLRSRGAKNSSNKHKLKTLVDSGSYFNPN